MDEATPKSPANAAPIDRLAVFVHGRETRPPDEAWLQRLAAHGVRLFSHSPVEGVESTDAGLAQLGKLCREIGDAAPGHALLVLGHALSPDREALAQLAGLAARSPGLGAFTAFNNAIPGLNPFSGLAVDHVDATGRSRLVSLLASGQLLPSDHFPEQLLLLTAEAVEALADESLSWQEAPGRLRARHVEPELADWIWVEAPDLPPDSAPKLDAHETARPRPWGGLSERLQAWLNTVDERKAASLPTLGSTPVTLHVTHSWGGGVAAWVASMIEGDPGGIHLQLRSEAVQTGEGAGQRMALYLGNCLDAPLASWWLQPPIQAVETAHGQYRELLDEVCRRFGVGRVIVSSLVGHGLDALRTERPTVQVLHDAFPAWPLLSLHPSDFDGNLEAALADPRAHEQFPDMTLEDWRRVIEQYTEAVQGIARVAPSDAARQVQALVEPGLEADTIPVLPHGIPDLPGARPEPRPRDDGRLRVVIPGRVQSGKGADLLEAALPGLLDVAQITLLGTGKGGERFFGQGGVNVVLQYDRDNLPDLLRDIGPHLALLPSTVPETFSYTLSEMHALGVPVIATALGSFVERIDEGETGWRVPPDAQGLVARVSALASEPDALERVRQTLADHEPRSLAAMVADYDELCPAELVEPLRPARHGAHLDLAEAQAASVADELKGARIRLAEADATRDTLETLVKQRTQWAEDEKRQRKEWVASLESELGEARAERDETLTINQDQMAELERRAAHIETLDLEAVEQASALETQRQATERAELRESQLEERLGDVQGRLDQVLGSHSWKLTMPLRVSRRMAANFMHLRAWNPLRWPLLLSQAVRNLSTVGLSGTVHRMQRFDPDTAPPVSEASPELVETPAEVRLPEALPTSEQPRVSVVIPAYNHLEHTAACLVSIAETHCRTSFEVIVVDDASSDDTQRELPGLAGLRYLRNPENQGFIGTCNHGAAEARGDFVLFLNNDTQVADGWIDALVETFEQRPDAGLVGGRLVYPDGSLQECGGMVFSDGSGWNYGRGDDPDRPEYQSLREVDYCSGACIMLRRELFDRLGGFDRHYAPAYYEDTDLAFKVREAGLKVYVQPRASIVHFEGVTSGTDIGSGTKRYQAVNREKFLERWKDALNRQPPPIADPNDAAAVRAARDHRLKGRVLIVDAYTPEPDQDSGSVRLVNLMRCLQSLGYGVTFFPDNRAWNGRYTEDLQALGVEAWYDPWLKSPESYLEAHGPHLDMVIVSRHYIACNYTGPVKRLAPQARFVFDTVDLHYLREQRLAELEDSVTLRQVAKQTRRSELGVIRDADATLVVSGVEQELLATDAPGASVFILSNIHEVSGSAVGFEQRKDLYFVGGYQHPPNIDAAQWFVNDIWPSIRERLPNVRFHLVGSKATDEVRALGAAEGVEFHGFVDSLDPFLGECRLSVAPLRYGAGVKGKVNQAMAHGQPVVATPAAVEGLGAKDGEDVLVADEAQAFADAVVRLYEDRELWERLSNGGIANVETHFSAEAAKRDLEALIRSFQD